MCLGLNLGTSGKGTIWLLPGGFGRLNLSYLIQEGLCGVPALTWICTEFLVFRGGPHLSQLWDIPMETVFLYLMLMGREGFSSLPEFGAFLEGRAFPSIFDSLRFLGQMETRDKSFLL